MLVSSRILGLALVAVALSGCSMFQNVSNSNTQTDSDTPTSDNQLFTGGIQAAMALGVPMKCSVTEADGTQVVSYIRGDNYFSEVEVENTRTNVLVRDNCMWTWEASATEGVTLCYDLEAMEPSSEGDSAPESIFEVENDFVDPDVEFSCVPEAVGDNRFEVPTEVNFTSMDQFMPTGANQLPTTEELNSLNGMSEADLEALIQQYSQ